MPEITMCTSELCVCKNRCYRHEAEPEFLQSYSNFYEVCNISNNFEYFLEIERKEDAQE